MGRLLSVNVGLPRNIMWQGKMVNTAVWKTPVTGKRMVRRLNIDGDGQADLAGHGGERRAVFVYQIESYRYWQDQLGRDDFVYGQFGENFTVEGLPDAQVCIGDRYRIGGGLFEVTQPRVTCYRLGIRMDEPEMAALVVKHGRPGFYLRVLEEGDVQAGDEITQVASGPGGMTVSEIDGLLYMPDHPRDKLERALRIPALSLGWQNSFKALLAQQGKDGTTKGNAGLTALSGPPAWSGFRPFHVSRKVRESGNVVSLVLEPTDGRPVSAALPGQFIVLRLGSGSAPVLTRSYSLSGEPSTISYRVSVKREQHGAASGYIVDEVKVGDIVEASAARGSFTLAPGEAPVVLLSAGIGVTPVLAMLHALAAEASPREVWWLHGTRNGREHGFVEETRGLLKALAHHHSYVCYSSPDPGDRLDVDFDAAGHLNAQAVRLLGLPLDGDFYVCGPSSFMSDLTEGLAALGVAPDRIHTEMFGAGPSVTPGVAATPRPAPHLPPGVAGLGALVSFARTGLNVRWDTTFQSLLELAEACDVPVRWSCRTGVCHTCETGLVAGAVAYRPDPIDAPADGNMLICCAQPKGDIVIDL
ncbi:ferredoxin-NADP reductase/MOSC domain-containing protein YiiM [Phyllobacterium sp. 1468]|uniref:MOSC and FAD-binding oxidoreductase domain-containing protein n=1 Tax=Phyllobacterium sp. 1468 TaxID=2817759 RepID=UPI002856AB51|nr:MOSC and FAD-binding oxidoreductase domain-containing protein [Phyllobacterium sp. 1468]MDR6634990.1 ferredoxin-NADP reductase/MOSC domain-containing protein YiiM [Phyllobacterium sp. 1468]